MREGGKKAPDKKKRKVIKPENDDNYTTQLVQEKVKRTKSREREGEDDDQKIKEKDPQTKKIYKKT